MSFENNCQHGAEGSGNNGRRPADNLPVSSATTTATSNSLAGQTSVPTVSGRLPSLRPTRDLTLGCGGLGVAGAATGRSSFTPTNLSSTGAPSGADSGILAMASVAAPNRRSFVPNLNAKSREKDKQTEKKKQSLKPKDSFNGNEKLNNNPKKPGKEHSDSRSSRQGHGNYVQTHSIFAEGLGGSERSSTSGAQTRGRGFGGGGGGGRASTGVDDSVEIKVEPSVEIRQKAEKVGRGDYFIADLRQGDSHPVRVPTPLKPPPYSRTVSGIKIKDEPMEIDSVDAAPAPTAETPADLFARCSESGEFFTLQLPSVLPQSLHQRQQHKQRPSAVAELSHGEAEGLERWPDGRIGLLQVLDTGEVRLLLDINGAAEAVAFNVSLGADVSHLQELLLLQRLSDEGIDPENGSFHCLGRVYNRMICSPDIDALLSTGASTAVTSTTAANTSSAAALADDNCGASASL